MPSPDKPKVNEIDGKFYTLRLDRTPCSVKWNMGPDEIFREMDDYERIRKSALHANEVAIGLFRDGQREEAERVMQQVSITLDELHNRCIGIMFSIVRNNVLNP